MEEKRNPPLFCRLFSKTEIVRFVYLFLALSNGRGEKRGAVNKDNSLPFPLSPPPPLLHRYAYVVATERGKEEEEKEGDFSALTPSGATGGGDSVCRYTTTPISTYLEKNSPNSLKDFIAWKKAITKTFSFFEPLSRLWHVMWGIFSSDFAVVDGRGEGGR